MRRLRLADRETPAHPARRRRSAVEPVQPSPARTLGRCAIPAEPDPRRAAPHRLRRPPVPSRPCQRTIGQRESLGPAPTRRRRSAVVSGDDGDHGHLAGIQHRPQPRAAHDPALGRAVSDHTDRVLQLRAVLQRRDARFAYPPPDHGRIGVAGDRECLHRRNLDVDHRGRRAVLRCGRHVRAVFARRALSGTPRPRTHRCRHRAIGQPVAGLVPAPG